MVFIALWEQDNGIGVLQRNLILEEAHIVVITLETMLHNEEMHSNEGWLGLLGRYFI